MADLDDFFAKKDRKKAKGKKFTTTEEIARKLEETGKKVEKPKPKDKPANPEGSGDDNQQVEEEDEWKEFEEEKKDYSGLKIGNLTVTETVDNDADEDRETGDNSSDQESGDAGSKQSGPWKKKDAPPEPEPAPPAPAPAPQPAVVGGVYRPPGFRNPQQEAPLRRIRSKNIAPDISSEEYFPTLNAKPATNDAAGVWGKKKKEEGNFEEVRNRGGTRPYATPEAQAQAPKLSLGNKYDALSQDQS